MKHLLYILVLGLVFIGCEPGFRPKKPDNLIAKDKMVEVLYDMFVVTSAKGVNRKKLEAEKINPEAYILDKYSIDSLQFAQSNNYYAHDIEDYKAIMENVKARLSAEKQRYVDIQDAEKAELKRKKDSIRNVKVKQRANPNLEANSSLKKID
ncbi:DUF4296 domain-containing protein [Winogradskyella litorisediminis]|uniref:DUF4296 domain-containing protein n=1 Tax=Winogradskyella litorisediminis TaxID=1156618 RepID=A0ABW3N637_9FLAO